MAIINFDATHVPPQTALEVIPAGWYLGQMVESEIKPTKDNTGTLLNATYEIIGGQYAGRKIFDRFNLGNKNPQAVEIAYKQLSAVCHAVGVIQCADSQQLHGRPLMIKVSLTPAEMGKDNKMYDAKNEISGYKAAEQNATQLGAAPTWASAPAQTAAPAWASAPTQPPAQFAPAQPPAQFAPAAAPAQQPWQTPPATAGQAPWQAQQPAQAPTGQQPWQAAPATMAPATAGSPPWAGQAVAPASQMAANSNPPWMK